MLPLMITPGKIDANQPAALRLLEEHFSRHIFIAGGTGNGKSKLIELVGRQLISQDCGITYIDPHGDGVDALMQYLSVRGVPPERVHLLEPGPDYCFGLDPFADAPHSVSPIGAHCALQFPSPTSHGSKTVGSPLRASICRETDRQAVPAA